jgi:hypothetical protein
MPERSWKRTERAVAARLGGRRVPVTGRQRGDAPDIAHDVYSIEVKHRRRLPGWLREAVVQALAAQRDGQLALAILHEAGTHHDDDLVVVRLRDWLAWFGDLPQPEGEDAV